MVPMNVKLTFNYLSTVARPLTFFSPMPIPVVRSLLCQQVNGSSYGKNIEVPSSFIASLLVDYLLCLHGKLKSMWIFFLLQVLPFLQCSCLWKFPASSISSCTLRFLIILWTGFLALSILYPASWPQWPSSL